MCVLTGSVLYCIMVSQQKKIAIVDAVKIFDEFTMKKELEEMAKMNLQKISKQVDNIGNSLKMAKGTHTSEDSIKLLSLEYSKMKAALDNEYTESNHDINIQVWKRLNPLLEAYGKEKGLHVIFGANGMGSVLYTDNYYDYTNDVIRYINKKYAQGN